MTRALKTRLRLAWRILLCHPAMLALIASAFGLGYRDRSHDAGKPWRAEG